MEDVWTALPKADKKWLEDEAERLDSNTSALIRRLVAKARFQYMTGDDPFDLDDLRMELEKRKEEDDEAEDDDEFDEDIFDEDEFIKELGE